jgi:hypothetical protein
MPYSGYLESIFVPGRPFPSAQFNILQNLRVNDKTLKIPIPAASYRALRNFAPSGVGFV